MEHKMLALFLILSSNISLSNSSCKVVFWQENYDEEEISKRYNYPNTLFCFDINLNNETHMSHEYNILNLDVYHIKELRIQSNIPKLYENTFDGFTFIEQATLSNISLLKIEPNVFLNWNMLLHLNLSHNELSSIDFHLPPNIRSLYLSHNKIRYIQELRNYNSLNRLDLSYNFIISIENFGPLKALKYLDLSYNNLSSIANITWEKEQVLNSVILSQNNFAYIPKTMEKIYIRRLDISYNNISTFNCANITEFINLSFNKFTEFCNFSKTIENIIFRSNAITHIYEHTFKNLENLQYLNLGDNIIETIFPGTFDDLINLHLLYLYNNSISELPIGLFYRLKTLSVLSIRKNNIEKLEHGIFTGLNRLFYLEVSENKINNLDAIYSLKSLHELNILDNHLYQLDVDQITKHLPHLSSIYFNIPGITCEKLMLYLLEFKTKGITVAQGNLKYRENINGIYCQSDSDSKIKKQETNEQRLEYIASYLSGISTALFVILVVLLFVIISTSFTMHQLYLKHRKRLEVEFD